MTWAGSKTMPRYRVDGNGALYIGYSMEVQADNCTEAEARAEQIWRDTLAFVRVHKPVTRPPTAAPELYDWVVEDNLEINACSWEMLPDGETP